MLLRKNIPFSYILDKVKYEIIIITIYSTLIYILKSYVNIQYLAIPATVPSILGTTISLLLAFRTNQSYDRWWEARTIWGAIVNDSRTFIRQTMSFSRYDSNINNEVNTIVKRISYRQIAWPYILGNSLREQTLYHDVKNLLETEEFNALDKAVNKANALLLSQSKDIQKLLDLNVLTYQQHQQLDNTILSLCNSMGASERIKGTVFPSMYSIFIEVFVYIFALSLPLALIEIFGMSEIPLTAIIVSTFFLVEKTAISLQNPFENKPTDTPVFSIARNIEINIRQMLGETEIPEKVKPEAYYIM